MTFSGLKPGKYNIKVEAPRCLTVEKKVVIKDENEHKEINVRLYRRKELFVGLSLHAFVFDSFMIIPLPGMQVEVAEWLRCGAYLFPLFFLGFAGGELTAEIRQPLKHKNYLVLFNNDISLMLQLRLNLFIGPYGQINLFEGSEKKNAEDFKFDGWFIMSAGLDVYGIRIAAGATVWLNEKERGKVEPVVLFEFNGGI